MFFSTLTIVSSILCVFWNGAPRRWLFWVFLGDVNVGACWTLLFRLSAIYWDLGQECMSFDTKHRGRALSTETEAVTFIRKNLGFFLKYCRVAFLGLHTWFCCIQDTSQRKCCCMSCSLWCFACVYSSRHSDSEFLFWSWVCCCLPPCFLVGF